MTGRPLGRKLETMINELQFIAVGAFLLWGLTSAVCDAWLPDEQELIGRKSSEGRQSDSTEQPSVHCG